MGGGSVSLSPAEGETLGWSLEDPFEVGSLLSKEASVEESSSSHGVN